MGLISFSAYLWHQPIFAFSRLRYQARLPEFLILILVALTMLLSYVDLTWLYVETPFRNKKIIPVKMLLPSFSLAASVFVCFGFFGYATSGFETRYPSELLSELKYVVPSTKECFGDVDYFIPPDKACISNADLKDRVAIMGDSHSAALASELALALAQSGELLQQFSFSGCPPIRGIHFIDKDRQLCPTYNDIVFSYIKDHKELKTLVLFARWPIYMNGYGYNNGEGGGFNGGKYLTALPTSKGSDYLDDSRRIGDVGEIFRSSIEELLKLGRRIVLVYPTPEIGFSVPTCVIKKRLASSDASPLSVSFSFLSRENENFS